MTKHRVHCFAASFGHDLAKELISRRNRDGAIVLDPFCGSGTTLVEALLAGHDAIGIDVDPISCLISAVQTRNYRPEWLDYFHFECLDRLLYFETELQHVLPARAKLQSGYSFQLNGTRATIPDRPEIDYWFSPNHKAALAALIGCRDSFDDRRKRDIFSVAISSVIIRKWPSTLSCAMDIDHSRPHRGRPLPRTSEQNFALFRRILTGVFAALRARGPLLREAKVVHANCAEALQAIKPGTVSLILSSPPYVNAIDYPRAHKFSEWWLSPETTHCKPSNYIGLRRDTETDATKAIGRKSESRMSLMWMKKHDAAKYRLFATYVTDMSDVISGCRNVLAPGGELIFVLANNRINCRTVPVTTLISDLLVANEFRRVSTATRRIRSTNRRYPFGFPDRMASEAVITAVR